MPKPWSSPADIEVKLRRQWDSGRILSAWLQAETIFPMDLSISKPSNKDLSERFEDVRNWIKALEEGSHGSKGFGFVIQWAESNHRQLGTNRTPSKVTIATQADALRLIGMDKTMKRFQHLTNLTFESFPNFRDWVIRKPHKVLEYDDKWERILSVLEWFRTHPKSGLYLRQLDIPGVDTKFIEGCKAVLTELVSILFPRENNLDTVMATGPFETRFGLLSKPPLIRFRILDEKYFIQGLSDLSVPINQFKNLSLPLSCIFITENEINGLAFPPAAESLVVFGLGYGVEILAAIPWLRDKAIYYWGDLDTHGFAILDRLRRFLPQTESFLMDRATMMEHQHLWVEEKVPCSMNLERLTTEENVLFHDLHFDRMGMGVRLEQERIGFGWLNSKLKQLTKEIL